MGIDKYEIAEKEREEKDRIERERERERKKVKKIYFDKFLKCPLFRYFCSQ